MVETIYQIAGPLVTAAVVGLGGYVVWGRTSAAIARAEKAQSCAEQALSRAAEVALDLANSRARLATKEDLESMERRLRDYFKDLLEAGLR